MEKIGSGKVAKTDLEEERIDENTAASKGNLQDLLDLLGVEGRSFLLFGLINPNRIETDLS